MEARAILRIAPALVSWLLLACSSSVPTYNPDPPRHDIGPENARCDEKASLCVVLADESASFFRHQAIAIRVDGEIVYARTNPGPAPERVIFSGDLPPGPHGLGVALWYEGMPRPSRRRIFTVSSHRFVMREGAPHRITIVSFARNPDPAVSLSTELYPQLRYDESPPADQ